MNRGTSAFNMLGDGDVYYTNMHQISDARLKTDIKLLDSSYVLNLTTLSGYDYLLKRITSVDSITKEVQFEAEPYPERRFGITAQEVEAVFPNLIAEDENGFKSIDYIGLIPVMIEVLKEQQNQINKLHSQLSALAEKTIKSTEIISDNSLDENPPLLFQNTPNPFDEITTIKYFIPLNEPYAILNIYNLQGQQIKNFDISSTGFGEVVIPASELTPGIYIYNLIVDDKVINSEQMILTE